MRKIDWEGPLSEQDIAWLRQAGFMSEDQIAAHQGQFDADVPDNDVPDDETTQDGLNPSGRVVQPVEGVGNGSPALVVPDGSDTETLGPDGVEDDYDRWTVKELEDEVEARNKMANVSDVEVTGTGQNGKILKADMVKGLRLWDQENPNAL